MATLLLSTPTTHSVSDVGQELTTGRSTWLYLCYSQHNWPKYLAVSLLLTTVFFLVLLIFRFRATSPRLNGYILICQMVTSPLVVRHVFHSQWENKQYIGTGGDVLLAYFSIWNLDFFRTLYSPFCLHPNASTLQVLSLDYIIAAYPLALIILTYTLVRLHYTTTAHLRCGCGGPSSAALLVVKGSGTFRTHSLMPLQPSSSCPMSNF